VRIKIQETESEIDIPAGDAISKHLNASNSPVLFGCRTGICGTCLVRVKDGIQKLSAPDADESELLSIIAEDEKDVRLACQLYAEGDITIEYLGKK
jgi:ferredoxin